MNNYLADTTVLIEHLRGNTGAKQFLEENNPSISAVTIAELIQGARDKQELTFALKIANSLPQIPIDKKISHRTLNLLEQFHLSHGLLFLDGLIAASAIENNMILISENVRDFSFIPDLKIQDQKNFL